MIQKPKMNNNLSNKQKLAGTFEHILQRVSTAPTSESSRIFTEFANSLLNNHEYDLSQIEQLSKNDQLLALTLFEFCMNTGLTEDERNAASNAFAPFTEINIPRTKH